jgi:hypothetical protein
MGVRLPRAVSDFGGEMFHFHIDSMHKIGLVEYERNNEIEANRMKWNVVDSTVGGRVQVSTHLTTATEQISANRPDIARGKRDKGSCEI